MEEIVLAWCLLGIPSTATSSLLRCGGTYKSGAASEESKGQEHADVDRASHDCTRYDSYDGTLWQRLEGERDKMTADQLLHKPIFFHTCQQPMGRRECQ